jgi:predicted outer membrane repeat protein
VKTTRSGAAAAAGHDLDIEVTSWEATLDVGDSSSLQFTADATSLKVVEGKGGMKTLTDSDKEDICKSIDKDVLKKKAISFSSNSVEETGGGLSVKGDLEIAGTSSPTEFNLTVGDDGTLSGSTTLSQKNWGIKPYSALFGALKVDDDVEIVVDGKLPTA